MSRVVIALDIGTKAAGSGWVCFESSADDWRPVDGRNTKILACGMSPNNSLLWMLRRSRGRHCGHIKGENEALKGIPKSADEIEVVFEGIATYSFSRNLDLTALWIGRLVEASSLGNELPNPPIETNPDPPAQIILRATARPHLIGMPRAEEGEKKPSADALVAQAIRERFCGMGATNAMAKGRKAQPGPLFGFTADIWAAMAVGIAYVEGAKREEGWR